MQLCNLKIPNIGDMRPESVSCDYDAKCRAVIPHTFRPLGVRNIRVTAGEEEGRGEEAEIHRRQHVHHLARLDMGVARERERAGVVRVLERPNVAPERPEPLVRTHVPAPVMDEEEEMMSSVAPRLQCCGYTGTA